MQLNRILDHHPIAQVRTGTPSFCGVCLVFFFYCSTLVLAASQEARYDKDMLQYLEPGREVFIDLNLPSGKTADLLPTWNLGQRRLFLIDDLLRMQPLLVESGRGYRLIRSPQHDLRLQVGSRFVSFDDRLLQLDGPIYEVESGLLLDFFFLDFLLQEAVFRGRFISADRLSLDAPDFALLQEELGGGGLLRVRFRNAIPLFDSQVEKDEILLNFPRDIGIEKVLPFLQDETWPKGSNVVDGLSLRIEKGGVQLRISLARGVELLELVEVESLQEIQLVLKQEGQQLAIAEFALPPDPVFEAPDRVLELRRIVLDPGHGGRDPGAVSPNGKYEKDVVLAICLELKKQLKRRMPGVEVLLTRDNDRALSLSNRTAFANEHRADLFVSVHANAAKDRRARGYEIFFLRHGKNRYAREVALRENAVLDFEGEIGSNQLVSAAGTADWILASMAQMSFARESQNLAALIAAEMKDVGHTRRRSVLQAGFQVLSGASMPAVLFECGFISNQRDERQMTSAKGHQQIAGALCDALLQFQAHYQ